MRGASLLVKYIKSNTGGWVEYTKAMEEHNWRNLAK